MNRPENLRLRPGTGCYSTLFRGTLFGQERARAVAECLSSQRVDILWLGSNPGVPRSLDNIINGCSGLGDLPSFQMQLESGLFGSATWSSLGQPNPDFNPIAHPERGWVVYQKIFEQVADLDRVTMANFIPWGSKNTSSLVTRLVTADRSLLKRMVEFSEELNIEVVQSLRPKLVVVPFSLGRNKRLADMGPFGLSVSQATQKIQHVVNCVNRKFRFQTAICKRGHLDVRTVFVPHPSSLRLAKDSRMRVVDDVADILNSLM